VNPVRALAWILDINIYLDIQTRNKYGGGGNTKIDNNNKLKNNFCLLHTI